MSSLRPLVIAAFCLVFAFFLVILACTVTPRHNAWPLMSLVLYCCAPLPFFLAGSDHEDYSFGEDSVSDAFRSVGLFLGGALVVSGPALAFVLYHTAVISGWSLVLTLFSGLFFLGCAVTITLSSTASDDNTDF